LSVEGDLDVVCCGKSFFGECLRALDVLRRLLLVLEAQLLVCSRARLRCLFPPRLLLLTLPALSLRPRCGV
jgi:hypothetical protein